MENGNNNIFRMIAGICFAGEFLVYIRNMIVSIVYGGIIGNANVILAYFMLALAIFISNHSLFIVGCAMQLSHEIQCAISGLEHFGLSNIEQWLFVVFWALLLVACCRPKEKKVLEYAAGAVAALRMFVFFGGLKSISGLTLRNWLVFLLVIVGAVLLGVSDRGSASDTSGVQVATVQTSTEAFSSDSIIEQLSQLKKLQDMGAITQEEFDAKKKKLLGF